MKRLALLAALLLSGAAFAQNDQPPAAQISMARGESKVLWFDEPISKVSIVLKGIVEAEPLTDRQLSLAGIAPGRTRLIVFSNRDGRQIYDATVTVNPEPGRIVKIYGLHDKNDDLNAGYSSTWCNEYGCGRPDGDLPKATTVQVERIRGYPPLRR